MVVLARYGIALTSFDDPCLMSYALDAGRAEHLPEQLAGTLLSYTCLTHKEIVGTGRAAVTFDAVPVARATEFAGEEADIGLRLWLVLKPRLIAEHVDTVYETLERPIAPVLALMERTGIRVERATLATLSGKLGGARDRHAVEGDGGAAGAHDLFVGEAGIGEQRAGSCSGRCSARPASTA